MIRSLAGTATMTNLAKAFAGESQARNRYTFYSEVAKDAGLMSLSDMFLTTANEERGHGEMFFEYLAEGLGDTVLEPQALVPVYLGDTAGNLLASSKAENLEWTDLYPSFGRVAQREGFNDIATSFFDIASVEKRHDMRFRDLLTRLQSGMLYRSCQPVTWQCANCGYRFTGTQAPDPCPACHHPQQYYFIVDPCLL